MSLDVLVDIIYSSDRDKWTDQNKTAFDELFGVQQGRYPARAKGELTLRAPGMKQDGGIPFAAYIHPANPSSGAYSGLSFVIFPVPDNPCLIGLVVGTGGLEPDQGILGRPGHARKVQAICAWLNKEYGRGGRVAWAKYDPTRTDISVPKDISDEMSEFKTVFDRYGREIYALYRPGSDREATRDAVAAFLDLLLEERGYLPLSAATASSTRIQNSWFSQLMPTVEKSSLVAHLKTRRFVIMQGPPGTGKTRMATEVLREAYSGFGQSIQFHPNTTYENFIGGLAPSTSGHEIGLRFSPAPGFLMTAAANALANPEQPYLLHIDEINRADLGKVLGEAVFLLEAGADAKRQIEMPYDFGSPFERSFYLPANLHILGTMNSADRSIAIVDVAVRRRFAFESLWPNMAVVEAHGAKIAIDAFRRLTSHFVEHASDDAFALIPGHSYFLEKDDALARRSLKTNLAPLLEEYLAQGYVAGFSEQIRSYLQWLRSL